MLRQALKIPKIGLYYVQTQISKKIAFTMKNKIEPEGLSRPKSIRIFPPNTEHGTFP